MVLNLIVVQFGVFVFDELCILLAFVGTCWLTLCIVMYLLACFQLCSCLISCIISFEENPSPPPPKHRNLYQRVLTRAWEHGE